MSQTKNRKGPERISSRPNTKAREFVKHLDKTFPNQSSNVSISPRIGVEREIANIRQLRNNGNYDEIQSQSLSWMLPENRDKVLREIAMSREGRFDWRRNPEDRNELASIIRNAYLNAEQSQELAAYREFEITSDIMATPFALSAFQSINLSADELPLIITPHARQYFTVRWIGQDGGARNDQWRTSRSTETLEMQLLSTDRVEYPLMDLQDGNVNEFSKINDQLRFDMEMKIDTLALTTIDAAETASGLKALMNIHPLIDQANMPDSNYLDLTNVSTYGPANIWTLARIKALLNHIALWGFGFSPAGPISLRNLLMSPLNARDSWDFVDLVSGWDTSGETWSGGLQGQFTDNPRHTVPTEVRNQIFNTGGVLQSAWGHTWNTEYNPRITKGRAYGFTNLPLGWHFTKSEFDRTIEWNNHPDLTEKNIAAVLHQKTAKFVVPDLWKYRIVIIDF